MRSELQVGALLALIGALGIAARYDVGFTRAAPPDMPVMYTPAIDQAVSFEETTGSIDRSAATNVLALSDEQRGWIFLGVVNLPDVPDVELPSRTLAAAIPDSIELQELPAMVTSRIPLVKDVAFLKLEDRILLVRPLDRVVVSEIPRYRVWQ